MQCSWNNKTSKYETMESVPRGEVDGLDEYVFIARARIGKYINVVKKLNRWETLDKKTSDPVFYVNIKSEKLRDILRTVL